MAVKIKKLSLEKTPEYIEREWGKVLSQRQHLLMSTDWMSLEDNGLTFESRIRWHEWRNRVRAVKKSSNTLQEAEDKLAFLEKNMPEREFIAENGLKQHKYELSITDLAQAKLDAHIILRTLHGNWTVNFIPENINLISAKMAELQRYLSMSPKPKSLKEFPLLNFMKKNKELNTQQLIAHVSELQRISNEVMLMIEEHRFKFTQKIDDATSIDEIIAVVKNMHGY